MPRFNTNITKHKDFKILSFLSKPLSFLSKLIQYLAAQDLNVEQEHVHVTSLDPQVPAKWLKNDFFVKKLFNRYYFTL